MEKPITFSAPAEEQSGLSPKQTSPFSNLGFFYIRLLGGGIGEQQLICLRSDRLYTIGRKRRHCQIVFEHCCISRRHCQIFLDSAERRLRLVDGFFLSRYSDLGEIKRRLRSERQALGFRVSLNGLFVNRRKLLGGSVAELSEGDEVVFGCGRLRLIPRCVTKYGFVVESIILSDFVGTFDVSGQSVTRANLLRNLCRSVLGSGDPISCLRCSLESNVGTIGSVHGVRDYDSRQCDKTTNYTQKFTDEKNLAAEDVGKTATRSSLERGMSFGSSLSNGQTFFLNRLEFMAHGTSYQHTEVTLMEVFDPVESLVQVFIATFTCDVSWYVTCDIYLHILPRSSFLTVSGPKKIFQVPVMLSNTQPSTSNNCSS